ncbi:hypothetical protein MAPG_05468 [Magnaporthiopsis poae ATCC 64411]|uniref:Nudix hydrolase domain-containing protein n=1 Tax=Magnaporthiopsis poae (strain ATCC 64411 / 73-15) TaxID=644358 RepID=A0A0C4DZG7_MAGP6|nr:hypothetical protein MAPG_05468 [Magnaporthiopsis poae ATCC 64411]
MSAVRVGIRPLTPKYGEKSGMGTVGVLIVEDRVLLVHQRLKNGTIGIDGPPDGGMGEDETPEQAIARHCERGRGDHGQTETSWCDSSTASSADPGQEPKRYRHRAAHCNLTDYGTAQTREGFVGMIKDDMVGNHENDTSNGR